MSNKWTWIKAKATKHFLVIGLVICATVAMSWPEAGKFVGRPKKGSYRIVQTINVCTIFVISGLTLSTVDLQAAVKAFMGYVYGLVAILIITPCLGFLMLEIPFDTKEYGVGLAIFACVPTTLTSGISLVMQAGGNTALALMLMVTSNILGVVTTPFALSLLYRGRNEHIKLEAVPLLMKMILTMLAPLLVGKFVREGIPAVKRFCSRNSKSLGIVSNLSLILFIWQSLSSSQDKVVKIGFLSLLQIIAAGIGMHLTYLIWNFGVVKLLRIQKKEGIAILILASQKTLLVSVIVIPFLPKALGNEGLIIIPCIVGHMAQLFIDAYIVTKWETSDKSTERNETPDSPSNPLLGEQNLTPAGSV